MNDNKYEPGALEEGSEIMNIIYILGDVF